MKMYVIEEASQGGSLRIVRERSQLPLAREISVAIVSIRKVWQNRTSYVPRDGLAARPRDFFSVLNLQRIVNDVFVHRRCEKFNE